MGTSKSQQNTADGHMHSLKPNERMYRPPRMMERPDTGTPAYNVSMSQPAPEKQHLEKKKLQELFNYQLRDMQQAEEKMAKSLPMMMKHSSRQELVKNVDAYLEQTKEQIKKLNMLAESIGANSIKPDDKTSSYLIEEGGRIVKEQPRKIRPRVMARPTTKRINLRQK